MKVVMEAEEALRAKDLGVIRRSKWKECQPDQRAQEVQQEQLLDHLPAVVHRMAVHRMAAQEEAMTSIKRYI